MHRHKVSMGLYTTQYQTQFHVCGDFRHCISGPCPFTLEPDRQSETLYKRRAWDMCRSLWEEVAADKRKTGIDASTLVAPAHQASFPVITMRRIVNKVLSHSCDLKADMRPSLQASITKNDELAPLAELRQITIVLSDFHPTILRSNIIHSVENKYRLDGILIL